MSATLGVWVRRWIECNLVQIPFARIKRCYEDAAKSGTPIEWKDLTTHFLAGGDPDQLVDGLRYAKISGAKLTVRQACAYQLFARANYQISLRDWLTPFVQSGIQDLGTISLRESAVREMIHEK